MLGNIDNNSQGGHGARVAQAHYAIDGKFLHRLGPELMSMFERASVAWHGLFGLKSDGSQIKIKAGHRREASQQLVSSHIRRIKMESGESQAIRALQAIYTPSTMPKSEGQAAALELVHQDHKPTDTLIIVLPTSSGKSALFYSIAAITVQQTVIVVVPFRALVDDVVKRGQAARLQCQEWVDESSSGELQQLVVVSADRAVRPEFLHYATGLQEHHQLAMVFFDECHVAITDTSYRARLRELWTLRYLECPFVGLTGTLMVQLEQLLRDRLLIPNAQLFRRSTARKTIRYTVHDTIDQAPSEVGIEVVQALKLGPGKRGIIYVRSYGVGDKISELLQCPFYKAHADQKSQLLEDWIDGPGGWVVATGALGTGIDIEGVVYIIHIDRPYGLTNFVQQSGRGGRGGEISDSIIIVRSKNTSGRHQSGILSEHSVELIDEEAMTQYIQSTKCRRVVLAQYLDEGGEESDCNSINGVFCDHCNAEAQTKRNAQTRDRFLDIEKPSEGQPESNPESGSQIIAQRLGELVAADELVFQVMDQLKRQCLYCALIQGEEGSGHRYETCHAAVESQCQYPRFQEWRVAQDLGQCKHCWKCGLSQEMCRGLERGIGCEYPDIMMPGLYLLHMHQHLAGVAETAGFQGDYEADFWDWIKEEGMGFGSVIESNWIKVWRQVCIIYSKIKGGNI